ncbi:MAG TPA: TraM recognition domain-containing protein [Streptosporangiaceae bacterium]|nr:TraM recognition domain-containing protein [Streptosporangiaceae bacterium]
MSGEQAVKILGLTEAGGRYAAGLTVADAQYHLHVPGVTGTGKTTLLASLILSDARAGRGAVVLDPKGDMVTDLLDRLPARMAGRLVLIDPAETGAPPALNVLDGADPELAADQVVTIFRRVFAAWWGPRMDDILRCACLTLGRVPGATLADIPALLTDPAVRAPLVQAAGADPFLRGFWRWYEALSEAGQANAAGPVLSKLRAVLTRRFAADLLGAARSTFDMGAVLDGGLLLARLPKGLLGEETARLAGSLIIAKVWQAALARAGTPERQRRDAALYADECQNFLHLPGALEDILAEARGYRLSLVLAHQHLDQLPRELAAAVSANARNKVCFTLDPADARTLARHLGPVLGEDDLAHLGRYQAACRLIADGEETGGFTVRTLPLPDAVPGRGEALRASARQRYGRTREQRRRDDLQRLRPGRLRPGHTTGKPGRVSPGVSAGVPAGVSPGVLQTPGETRPPARPAGQLRRGFGQPAAGPDSWDKP